MLNEKTLKQIAAEAQEQVDKAQLSLSIRELYRKLASALHLDRESDLQERKWKTALMQRANHAYSKNNLLHSSCSWNWSTLIRVRSATLA